MSENTNKTLYICPICGKDLSLAVYMFGQDAIGYHRMIHAKKILRDGTVSCRDKRRPRLPHNQKKASAKVQGRTT